MTKEIPLRLKSIENHLNRLNDGYSKVHFLSIKNDAEALVRVCNQELGGYVNNLPILETPELPPDPQMVTCKYCDWKTDKGEYSMKSHVGRKHKNVKS